MSEVVFPVCAVIVSADCCEIFSSPMLDRWGDIASFFDCDSLLPQCWIAGAILLHFLIVTLSFPNVGSLGRYCFIF